MNDRCRNYSSHRGVSDSGRRVRDRFVKDRTTIPPTLRKVGETDQYSLIQSFKDECDIQRIVARAEAGDSLALQRVQGLYFDSTLIPEDPTTVMQSGTVLRSLWDSLSPDIQADYGSMEALANALIHPATAESDAGSASVQTENKTENQDNGGENV